jgi:serine/threonine protein kinase
MYGYFDDSVNIYLIMEAATGGQLFKQLKKHQSMPELKVAAIMRQVCQAVN